MGTARGRGGYLCFDKRIGKPACIAEGLLERGMSVLVESYVSGIDSTVPVLEGSNR